MALTIRLTPGYVYTDNELDTAAKRNALGNPTIELEGSIGTLALADGAVTTPKLADGVLSNDTAGHLKMEDGYLSANSEGRGKMEDGYLTAVKAEETFREGVQQYSVGIYAAGTYAVTLNPAATAYTTGMRVVFNPDTTNTGVASINVNGLGAKTIKAIATRDVAAGRIAQNQIIEVVYDGTNFVLTNERNTFDLGETGIATGVPVATAHGLGRTPGVVYFALRCHTAEFGYLVNDEISLPSGPFQPGANSGNIFLICNSTTINTWRKDTAAACTLTPGNWRIVGYARL